ncbi:MAG: ATP-binding cassette domain-containing protein [Firmicutes bacterium]|nr:ATP-binding cassette domain-containing protein [Dethiobacter sp.]MBS3889428.1 ATP-binding cassette domain-containing protein [Bacillota bacterium]MBS4053362.1 ATP-binding cassette domain-containing protein [Thermaerobacter sp.]
MLEQGTDLSVGEWQKIAIARALLRHTKAELVLLDESTAAIDPQSEHRILEICPIPLLLDNQNPCYACIRRGEQNLPLRAFGIPEFGVLLTTYFL